jgi:hypothetical protein
MLHFSINKPDVVYIVVFNSGEARHIQNVILVLYAFVKE